MFKKLLLLLLVLFVAVAAAVFFLGGPTLNKGLRKVVVDYGPELTGGPVSLENVQISPWNGTGALSGFVIGNPPGFTTEKAMSLGNVEIQLNPRSVLGETIEIKRIAIDAPELVLERAQGTTNLQRIQENIAAIAGGNGNTTPTEEPTTDASAGKKISIAEFVLSNAKVTVTGFGMSRNLTLPTIRLTDLGTSEGGVPPAEIAKEVLDEVLRQVTVQAQEIGVQFLNDPQGTLDAARGQLDQLREQANQNLQGAEGAVNQLRDLLGKPKPKPAQGGN